MSIGVITLKFENISLEDLERIRRNIHTQFTEGVFFIKRGQVVLNFNPEGMIKNVELKFKSFPELFPLDKTSLLATIEQKNSG